MLPPNTLDTLRQVWLSLVESLLLSRVLVCTCFYCAPQESVFPALWMFCNQSHWPSKSNSLGILNSFAGSPGWGNGCSYEFLQQWENFFDIIVLQFVSCPLGSSMVELMVISSNRTDATCHAFQVCCSQIPCPHGRALLTCASTGDTQTLSGRSGSVSCGGHCSFPWVLLGTRFCFCPQSISGGYEVWLNMIVPFLPTCWGSSFALGCRVSFFSGIQHSPVDGCSAASWGFAVLTGEDENMSFYSAIFPGSSADRIHLQCRRPQFNSWVRKIPWRRDLHSSGATTPVFKGFPGDSYGKESACNTGDLGLKPRLGKPRGKGHSSPLQYLPP